jgi:PAS domain S-box-containing protein
MAANQDDVKSSGPIPFRAVFENAPTGMALLDLDGRVLQVNRALCRILRADEKYLLSGEFEGVIFPNDSEQAATQLSDLTAGRVPYLQEEKEYVYAPSRSIWILVSTALLHDKDRRPLHLISHIQEITEHKEVEKEKQTFAHQLSERVKELRALHYIARLLHDDEKPTSILLQEIVTFLPVAWEYADLAAARIIFDGAEYKSPNFIAMGGTQSADFMTAGGKHGVLEMIYPQTGADQVKPSFLAEEKSLLDSLAEMLKLHLDRKEARDRIDRITRELIERNKELWSLQQEMGRVEQRVALGWMTGAIAHELGTPLNSVLGYTHLLTQEELSEKALRHVKTITSQVQRMTSIVQYYLDRTRGSTSKRSWVNINDLVSETLLLLDSVFAQKNVHPVMNLEESLPLVNAHGGSLQRVLINLLNNALASIRDKGEITIATRTELAQRQRPGVVPGIIMEVSDTGVGISADLLPRIFDLFMTTRPEGNGTGLGLAVSQEIVKEHGGKITIDSQVERGTTVTVFLPTNFDRMGQL